MLWFNTNTPVSTADVYIPIPKFVYAVVFVMLQGLFPWRIGLATGLFVFLYKSDLICFIQQLQTLSCSYSLTPGFGIDPVAF